MDRLTRYNQKLLAIIGTLVLASLSIILLISAILFIIDLSDVNFDTQQGVQVNPNVNQKDSTVAVRSQQISMEGAVQLDTGRALYILPVGQINLKEEEKIEGEPLRALTRISSGYGYRSYGGYFNNFVLIDYDKNLQKKVFQKKVVIDRWAYMTIKGREILLFKGTNQDTNKDNLLDNSDFQVLYVLYLDDLELKQYDFEDGTLIDFEPMDKTNFISLRIGLDKDNDHIFNTRYEALDVMMLNIENREILPIIPESMKIELQKTLDQNAIE